MSRGKTKKSGVTVLIRILAVIALVLIGVVAYMGYIAWCDNQVVFRDVTVELGTESLSLRDFMTEKAKESRVEFVSDPSRIDLGQVGQTSIRLKHGIQTYTVVLTVEDTQAPEADVPEQWEISVLEETPQAEALVSNIRDESQVRVYYSQEPVMPEDYSDLEVGIILEDEGGNKTEKTCRFHYYGWLQDNVILELGETLTPEMLLTNPEKDRALLDQVDLNQENAVGEYTIDVTSGNTQESCVVTVRDTVAPVLTLKNVRRYPGESVEIQDFVVENSDLSGEPLLRVVGELPDCSVEQTHTITIEAEDLNGNVTSKEATLWVSKNMSAPVIQGATEPMTVEKHSSPDFLEGVFANDDMDGRIAADVDTSALDLSKAGTYYITYSSTDSSGNVGTYKRKVTVEPDGEDTAALVQQIADSLPNDPEAIRDYVHDNIAYSSHWGGDDPVWHGFTQHTGNCNVHARSLKALLDYKGYETQLIWVTNESHYWLIIKLEEGWRHIDSTPSDQHEKIGLATDKVRYQNLNGRNWDRTLWPACE